MKTTRHTFAALCVGALGWALMSCDGESVADSLPTDLPAEEAAGLVFKDLDGEWERRIQSYHQGVAKGTVGQTTKTAGIQWEPDVSSAMQRARAEGKPIFLTHFVRQNGDPACDV